jgi:competence protein ComEC
MSPVLTLHPAWLFMAGCLLVQLSPAHPSLGAIAWLAGAVALLAAALWLLGQRLHTPQRSVLPLRLPHGVMLVLGFGWATHLALEGLSQRLPPHLEGERLVVDGFVNSLVRGNGVFPGWSFALLVTGCSPGAALADPASKVVTEARPSPAGWCPLGHQILVRVTPDRHDAGALTLRIRAGSRWQADVRLSALHAQRNPGGRDLELHALQSGWVAKGHARASDLRFLGDLAAHSLAWVHRSREVVQQALRQSAPDQGSSDQGASDLGAAAGKPVGSIPALSAGWLPHSPRALAVIEALVIGSGEGLDPEQWNAFNRTGVGHLLSISGSHVTMFSALSACLGLAFLGWIGAHGWAPLRWSTLAPARLVFAAGGAVFYTLLAGFGLPAQRTCAMVIVTGLLALVGRGRQVQPVLAWAGLVVCVIDPWAVISPGFWLSFAAVSALVWSGQLRQRPRFPAALVGGVAAQSQGLMRARWRTVWERTRPDLELAVRGQWAASVVMIPLSVLFFAQISWISPLANAVAIPWITFVVTPLSLLLAFAAVLCPSCTSLALAALAWVTEQSLRLLDVLASQAWISSHATLPPALVVLLGVLACVMLLWPIAPWPRWFAALLLVPTVLWPSPRPGEGELEIVFLDVGQGSAVFLRNRSFSLIYDVGPAADAQGREDGRNAGFQLVLPALRAWGLQEVDAMVISHADLDHAGGALALHRHLRIAQVLSGSPGTETSLRGLPVGSCNRRTVLEAGETTVRVLHPQVSDPEQGPTGFSVRRNRNAQSCVLLISHRGRHILLPGDLPALQESALLSREPEEPEARVDVLLLGHHGAASSSSAPWLDYWKPSVAVVQSGYANRYGHPDPSTVARLHERGILLRRTDLEGALSLRIDAEGVLHWRAERSARGHYWTR